jgi:Bromodomain
MTCKPRRGVIVSAISPLVADVEVFVRLILPLRSLSAMETGIGQTKDVRVYRLVTSRSFEQEMFDRASKKLGLEQAVLGTFEKEWDDDKPTQQEMEQLLKRGAYALLDDDNDEVTKQFCADDIESILAKRTRTRVVEGTKTASWLNKQGMMVSKSKFTSETGENLDMDDPLFWQKVMPDFVTPSIMLQKLRDLEDEIEGKVRGPGRGRGRWKKKKEAEAAEKDAVDNEETVAERPGAEQENGDVDQSENESVQDGSENEKDLTEEPSGVDALLSTETLEDEISDDESRDTKDKSSKKLSRNSIQKINKFMSDLKSMMQSTFEDDDEDALSSEEKNACQKLLLTVSVKDKLFNEEQRLVAKKFLKRFEGDRRRRCRTSEQPRFRPGIEHDEPVAGIREELMIMGKKRKKRKKRGEPIEDAEPAKKKKRRSSDNTGGYLGDDGYLHHSDSEDDWSDVGHDIYQAGTKKDIISRKEANRRRHWAADDDAATAAGRAWPVFPRPLVKKVLTTVLDNVIKYDKERGGVFSVPVPKDEFPEYYKQIKKPMDYGTMKTKLENGEYRSAQAMQKDFILIMQNCRTFNADSSDIVREAREQHLMRPKFLKEAAEKHNLFLAEDGSVLEIIDDKPGSAKKKGSKKKADDANEDNNGVTPRKKVCSAKSPSLCCLFHRAYCFCSVLLQKTKKGTKPKVESDEEADRDEPPKKKAKTTKSKSKVAAEEANDGHSDVDDTHAKKVPRIRIKVKAGAASDDDAIEAESKQAPKERKKPAKRKRDAGADSGDESVEADITSSPIPKKRKKNTGQASKKKRKKKPGTSVESSDDDRPLHEVAARKTRAAAPDESADDSKSIYLDPQFWKKCRDSLNGSYKAARKNLTQRDAWELPPVIPDDKFADVANYTLDKMDK